MLLDRERVKFWQKIVFGGLAVVFAASFVIGGVGSGTNFSLSDIFGNNNSGGGNSSNPSSSEVSKLQKQTKQSPRNAALWVRLGAAYEAAQDPDGAASAYQRALKLKPHDQSTLQALATIYSQKGNALANQVQTLQQEAYALQQNLPSSSSFTPGGSSVIGSALQSPVDQARAGIVNDQASKLQAEASKLQAQSATWYQKALPQYRELTKLNAGDPSTWIQYGLAAQHANDTTTAVAAFRRFLKIAPDDPDAQSVRNLVNQLAPPPTTSTATGGATTGG